MKYSIISCGWNCQNFVIDWYNSLKTQVVDWDCHVMDDASTDRTYSRLKSINDDRIKVYRNLKNMGAAYSRWELIKQCDGDVIVLLDLDDFLTDRALSHLVKPYSKGKLMTWGSYKTTQGKFNNSMYSQDEINTNTFLKGRFKCPPLRTFSKNCLEFVKESHLKINGNWVQTCTDVALMFPILKALKFRDIASIEETLYVYRYRPKHHSANRFSKTHIMNALRVKHER